MPFQRAVIHTAVLPAAAPVTIQGCTRRKWTKNETATYSGGAGLNTERTTFIIPTINYTNKPTTDDNLTDNDGVSWTILGTTLEVETAFLAAVCVKAR